MNPPDGPALHAGDPTELPLPTTAGPAPPATPPLQLRLHGSGDLLAAVPHLLGFVPAESLVLVAVTAEEGRSRVGAVARVDLPPPADLAGVVAAAARRMGRRRPEEVAAVVVGGAGDGGTGADGGAGGDRGAGSDGAPPRADVVDAVEELFAAVRVAVRTRLWTPRIAAGAPWRCYPPCGCSGVLPDHTASTAALASTLLGHVTFTSREELAALVRADPEASGARRRRLLDEALAAGALDRELAGAAAARRDLLALRRAAAEVGGGGVLGDVEIARLAAALCRHAVRDAALAFSLGTDGVSPAAAEALWTLLVRAVPAPEVAEPAALLACAALARGGGALVGAALERAAAADPGHSLSALLRTLLDTGVGHADFLAWLRCAEEAEAALLGSPP